MYAANSYVLRLATDADAPTLSRLADLDGKEPLEGSVLIGELHGEPVAALSLRDDRTISDPFKPTADVVELLRVSARQLSDASGGHRLRRRAA